jgi:ubiquinol-cytochrome c reductase cytochrome b subunit
LIKTTGKSTETVFDHLAISGIARRLQELNVRTDALTWHRFFGALLLALLVLLVLSGAFMAFYYSPAPGSAYDSVDYALFTVPFGDVIKGVHHYGWNLFLMVLGVHLVRAFLVGAYKAPRQLVWVSGVMILLIVPTFIITGDLLSWDQKGYWSTQVRLSIIGSIPFIGDFIVRLLQGGPLTGIVALTRFYVLHILFLPSLLVLLIVIHLHFLRHRGLSKPFLSGGNFSTKTVPFFPVIVNRWLILLLCVTLVLGLISWYWPAPLGDPADPTDSTYVPKPEWWVLFLNQLVTIFRGPLSVIGSVIIPGGLAGLLIALPFIDSSSERHLARRKKVILVAAIIAIGVLVLSIMGYMEHFRASHA